MSEIDNSWLESDLSDDFLCPVCLDLLHNPQSVEPCRHAFCDPCLRRLAQTNPFNCPCPLCRTPIKLCRPLKELTSQIKLSYSSMYQHRMKHELTTTVYSQPLPWKPSWRNVMKGHPMGGNRMIPLQSEYIRAALYQIPCYFIPLVVAALVNTGIFAFMMQLVELVPTTLAFLFHFFGVSVPYRSPYTNYSHLMAIRAKSLETFQPHLFPSTGMDGANIGFPGVDMGDIETSFLDTTFYYILCALTCATAAAGQLYLNPDMRLRVPDVVMVLVMACIPLLLLPVTHQIQNFLAELWAQFDEGYVRILMKGLWEDEDTLDDQTLAIKSTEGYVLSLLYFLLGRLNCASALILVVSSFFIYYIDIAG